MYQNVFWFETMTVYVVSICCYQSPTHNWPPEISAALNSSIQHWGYKKKDQSRRQHIISGRPICNDPINYE